MASAGKGVEMKWKSVLAMLAAITVMFPMLSVNPASAEVDIYTTPGTHNVNGREWRTNCAKYSSTVTRCRTEIKATQISEVRGRYVATTDWVFNNLTYKPVPRSLWGGNPLASTGAWTATDGRKWRTECDTPATGRNGCRSYAVGTVIEKSGNRFVKSNKWVFNNIVTFTGATTSVTPSPAPTKPQTTSPAGPVACKITPPAGQANYYDHKAEDCIFNLVNKERQKEGLAPLIRNSKVDTVARNWTMTMAQKPGTTGFFHNPAVAGQLTQTVGNWRSLAENIGYTSSNDTAISLHNAWMNSPGHKSNIMEPSSVMIGIGLVCRSDSLCFGTQVFFTPFN